MLGLDVLNKHLMMYNAFGFIMKDGILLIDKPKGITSRDVVNLLCKRLNTKRIGHTGTLDPMATGLMIVCVNKATKLVEILTNHDKSYIAKVKLGIKTDTYDITGNVILEDNNYHITEEKIKAVLKSFIGEYFQEVPIYSSIKVNGKRLYEYARKGETVTLPKHLVEIKKIKLLEYNNDNFTFEVSVSKGTYIRSLVNDISNKIGICMTLEELRRITVDKFNVDDAKKIDDITYDDVIDIKEIIDFPILSVNGELEKKIRNGVKIKNIYNYNKVLFVDEIGNNLAIYEEENGYLKSYKGF